LQFLHSHVSSNNLSAIPAPNKRRITDLVLSPEEILVTLVEPQFLHRTAVFIGLPQCGHFSALEDTSFLHSLQVIKAI